MKPDLHHIDINDDHPYNNFTNDIDRYTAIYKNDQMQICREKKAKFCTLSNLKGTNYLVGTVAYYNGIYFYVYYRIGE